MPARKPAAKAPAKKPVIYSLCDPETLEVRYIGKAVDAEERYRTHQYDMWRRDTPLYRWMRGLSESGAKPVLVVVASSLGDDWMSVEKGVIKSRRDMGCDLLNVAAGGNQPHCPIDVRRENGRKVAAMINADPRRKRFAYLKRELNRLLRQGYASEATRAKMRLAAARRPDIFGGWANA